MDAKTPAIWIDLDNSPHVPLLAPIVNHYRSRGTTVLLTARDHAQTLELLDLSGLGGTFTVVGRHYGKGKLNKIRGLLVRAVQLRDHVKNTAGNNQVAVALSHGSRSMVLAARWLGIPVLTMYDYEFTETTIFNRFSERVLVPAEISGAVLDEIGLPEAKRAGYAGIKEELYLRGFSPTSGFRQRFLAEQGISGGDHAILAVLRPPATTANYHSTASEDILKAILSRLLASPGVFTVIVPRTPEQAREIGDIAVTMSEGAKRFSILDRAVDGLELAFASDLLISGGGTMNREAALLGVPVYSIFAGRQGSLDAAMEAEGKIKFIRTPADVADIVLAKREPGRYQSRLTDRVERFVIDQLDAYLQRT